MTGLTMSLVVQRDSYNSYPDATLIVQPGAEYVGLQISDSLREIAVTKSDLIQVLRVLEADQ